MTDDELLYLERDISILDVAIASVNLTKEDSYQVLGERDRPTTKHDILSSLWKAKQAMERRQRAIGRMEDGV